MPPHWPTTRRDVLDVGPATVTRRASRLSHFVEAKVLIRKTLPVARRVIGEDHDTSMGLRCLLHHSTVLDPKSTRGDVQEAKKELDKILCQARRVLGATHPRLLAIQKTVDGARERLAGVAVPQDSYL